MIDFVSVFCNRDLRLQILQARSIACCFRASDVGRLILVANGSFDLPLTKIENVMRRELGGLEVMFLRHDQLGVSDQMTAHNGWLAQQALKLEAGRLVQCDRYVVLDAKNHFLRPAAEADVVSEDGRWRATCAPLHPMHRETFAGSYAFLEVPSTARPQLHVTVHTPFVFERDVVLRLLAEVRTRGEASIAELFARMPALSEFALYQAFLVKLGSSMPERTVAGARWSHTMFWHPNRGPGADIGDDLAVLDDPQIKVAGVHWVLAHMLSPTNRWRLSRFWYDRHLTYSPDEGDAVLRWTIERTPSPALRWMHGHIRDVEAKARQSETLGRDRGHESNRN